MKWGEFEIHRVSDGRLWLDGGAMFGVVPRALWQRRVDSDAANRIPLGLNCLLVKAGGKNVLIDTGCGHKYSDKEIQIYRIDHQPSLIAEIHRFGLAPEDIDIVINTHLHFDHCGGNTIRVGDQVVPTFPNAIHYVQRREFDDANHPNERTRATYFQHNWMPIVDRGRFIVLDEDREIVPGIEVVNTPGHTLGHQSVKITSGGRTLFYIADLCPTSAHVSLPWIMGYDLFPLTTLETRKKIYRQAIDGEWLLFLEHEPGNPSGYLREEGGNYSLEPETWKE